MVQVLKALGLDPHDPNGSVTYQDGLSLTIIDVLLCFGWTTATFNKRGRVYRAAAAIARCSWPANQGAITACSAAISLMIEMCYSHYQFKMTICMLFGRISLIFGRLKELSLRNLQSLEWRAWLSANGILRHITLRYRSCSEYTDTLSFSISSMDSYLTLPYMFAELYAALTNIDSVNLSWKCTRARSIARAWWYKADAARGHRSVQYVPVTVMCSPRRCAVHGLVREFEAAAFADSVRVPHVSCLFRRLRCGTYIYISIRLLGLSSRACRIVARPGGMAAGSLRVCL